MKKIAYLIVVFAPFLTVLAQSTTDYVDNIKKRFPDEVLYVEEYNQKIVYSVSTGDKSTEPVLGISSTKLTEYISLINNVNHTEVEFYDSFSEIQSMTFSKKTSKNYTSMYVMSYDKAYEMDGIFHNDVRKKLAPMNFATKGDQIKAEIVKTYKDHTFFDALYFHQRFGVKKSVISIRVPKDVTIDIHKINFDKGKITEIITTEEKTNTKVYTYEMEDLPPGIAAGYGSTGYSMNFPHIIVVVKNYSYKGVTKKGFETFDDFYAYLHQLNSEVKNDDEIVKKKMEAIIAGKTSDEEKIKAIYYWVQDNIRYIAFEDGIAGYKPMAAQEVLEKKYGDCKGVANLVSRMLNLAGYDAKFVWIHTNFSPYDCTIPYLGNFNHAIAYLEFKGKEYFLDCTESYAAFGQNAFRIQGRKVMVEMGDTYKIVQIPMENSSFSKFVEKTQLKFNGTNLTGVTQFEAYGDMKNYYLRKYHFAKSEDQQDYFRKLYNKSNANMDVTSTKNSDLENREIPLTVEVKYNLSNQVVVDGNEMYLNMEYDPYFHKVLKDTVAYMDMSFDESVDYFMSVSCPVPAGYKVKEIPQSLVIEKDYCTIKLEYSVVNNAVVYSKTYIFPTGIIPKDKLKDWVAIQKQLKKAYTNQVTFTK
ncbi:MAG: transglutaminase domain-containing protein [Cytophagaceae bacterium]